MTNAPEPVEMNLRFDLTRLPDVAEPGYARLWWAEFEAWERACEAAIDRAIIAHEKRVGQVDMNELSLTGPLGSWPTGARR